MNLQLSAEHHLSLAAFYQKVGETLDAKRLEEWPDYFTADCVYRVQARENHDAGLPLATMSFESQGMLKDRIHAVRQTLYYEPYWQRHVIGFPTVASVDHTATGLLVHASASYAVFRTKPDQVTEVFNVGRYVDVLLQTPEAQHGWLIQSRVCVFDSDLVLNSMIDPI
jgi:salicylate 5-hydroxylase small subunit